MSAREARLRAPRPPDVDHIHRDVTGGWLRPAVFGVMDGLVSNFALIAGVAGGGVAPSTIVLTGLAGLAAGAFSMATGEYVSVSSQSEHARAEIEVERRAIERRPDAEERELALRFRRRGLSPTLAAEVARQLSANPDEALLLHVREELGVDPHDLPSGRSAAAASFVAFAIGALLPVLPYLLGARSLLPALVVAALGLFSTGVFVAWFTARPWWYVGGRQLLLGALAAVVTYVVGSLVGAGLG